MAVTLAACAGEPAEIEGELGGWPEEEAVDGSGRFVIEGEEVELRYQTIGGHRTFEGDIVLDDEQEVSEAGAVAGAAVEGLFAVSGSSRLWPHGVIPYVIDGSVTTPGNVRTAIRTWEATGLRFVPRTTQRAYVTFLEERGNSLCRTQAGYSGGRRYVYLRDTSRYSPCNLGVIVHETGHVIGLWHEHTRPDRGSHVAIHWSHVPSASRAQFEIMTSGARRIGAYDITSSMHYRSYTLTSDGHASITRADGRLLLHDWSTISRGDVAAVRALYFDGTPVPTPDAGAHDAGARDAGARDAGPRDAGPRDAGPRDTGATRVDAGAPVRTPDASPLGGDAMPLAPARSSPARPLRSGCAVSAGGGSSGSLALALACSIVLAAGSRAMRTRARVRARSRQGARSTR